MALTQEDLKNLFDYKDGKLFWKQKRQGRKQNKPAGWNPKTGYCQVTIDGKMYYLHRLVWFYHYGYLPEKIDHKDNDPSNNVIHNLREATSSENAKNKKIASNNRSGVKGVSFCKQTKKWKATIANEGFLKTLGRFETILEASHAVEKARQELHKEFARCR